jgi:hypothetical protein
MTHGKPRLAAFAATIGITLLAFWSLIHLLRPGWQSSEYTAIVVWTVPLALLMTALAKPLRQRVVGRALWLRAAVGLAVAVVCAVGWTFAAVALTGGYALAFDANPLWCWMLGSLAGALVALSWPDMRRGANSVAEAAT